MRSCSLDLFKKKKRNIFIKLLKSTTYNYNFIPFFFIAELGHWRAQRLSCLSRNILGVFCMGAANDARHRRKFTDMLSLNLSLTTFPRLALQVLNKTFPDHTFLMNGLVMGIKGILSFLSAPLIGALSDVWGRKFFLLITVFFTCLPIPLMTINTWWVLNLRDLEIVL